MSFSAACKAVPLEISVWGLPSIGVHEVGALTSADRLYSDKLVGRRPYGPASSLIHLLSLFLEVVDHHLGVEKEMLCGEQQREAYPQFCRWAPKGGDRQEEEFPM